MRAGIFTCSAGYGHDSAARTIQNELFSRGISSEILEIYEPYPKLYQWITRNSWVYLSLYTPSLFGYMYKRMIDTDPETAHAFVRFVTSSHKRFYDVNSHKKYDVIVSTHPSAAMASTFFKSRSPWILNTQVVLDYALPNGYIVPGIDLYYTADHFSSDENIRPLGIPIRKGFGERFDRKKILKQFGLSENRHTILVMRGGFGFSTGMIDRLLVRLAGSSLPIQLVVLCGKNDQLKKRLERNIRNTRNKVVFLGFTDKVAELMGISYLYLGKPGGISMAECFASELPVLVYEILPGQEEFNVNYITKNGLGYHCRSVAEILESIRMLIKNPGTYLWLKENLAMCAKKDSTKRIVDSILEERTLLVPA